MDEMTAIDKFRAMHEGRTITTRKQMMDAIKRLPSARSCFVDTSLRYYSRIDKTDEVFKAQVWMSDDAGDNFENILHSGYCESWDEAYLNLKTKVQDYNERV